MWIKSRYYKRLIETLEGFAKGNFNFDESEFDHFRGTKYLRLTALLQEIKDTSSQNIESSLKMLDSIYKGDSYEERAVLNFSGDHRIIYDRYSILLKGMETLKNNVSALKASILESNEVELVDLSNLNGIWYENSKSLNEIVEYFVENTDEITQVLIKILQGDLTQKVNINGKGKILELKTNVNTLVDQFVNFLQNMDEIALVLTAVSKGDLTRKVNVNARGEVLELKNSINQMVDQLLIFASEITRVTEEVGNNGKFGVKAKVDDASGLWRDLTNNINKMSQSLHEIDEKNRKQNWIKDGVSLLSKEILYKDLVSEQFEVAITQLCRYINAGMGAIYTLDSTTNELCLEAYYAYENNTNSRRSFKIGEGVIGQVAIDKKPILIKIDDPTKVVRTGTTEFKITSTYTSPLIFKEQLIGVVEVATYSPFNDLQIEFIEETLSVLAGSFYASIQSRDNKKLEYISKTDALTGLSNRGYFEKIVPEVLDNGKRIDALISFAILDIDYFKKFNDTYGHKVGDKVLKAVSGVIKELLKRDDDYSFRIGGEEFAVIFSAFNKEKALRFMDKVRTTVEDLELKDENDVVLNNITVSIGLICKRASEIKDVETLFKEADGLLYRAKNEGRNRVISN